MGYQSKTYSLSDEVVEAIESAKARGTSPNKFLRQLMGLDAEQVVKPGFVREARPIDLTIASGTVADNRPKNAYCKHCGSRFAGAKYATICSGCKGDGHTLTPAECPRCTEASAL